MNEALNELIYFLMVYAEENPGCTKNEIAIATAEHFSLQKTRSVFHGQHYAIRFSFVRGRTFSNGVLALSVLRHYDNIPFIVCVVRPVGIDLLLANSTFLKKISHSSQQLRVGNVRGTFLGHDIMREFDGIENAPENFPLLFDSHSQFTWEENLDRLVEATNRITHTGKRFDPTDEQERNILYAPKIAKALSVHPEYLQLYRYLDKLVQQNLEEILEVGKISNVNLRGNTIEQIVTQAGNLHDIEDFSWRLQIGPEVKVDIKTKILTLSSNPKGYNIDKLLKTLAFGNTVFSFFFIGINNEARFVLTCLVSIFDRTILNATRIQFHWAGRNSRGVTQLTKNIESIFSPEFVENIDVIAATEFLQMLIELKPPN